MKALRRALATLELALIFPASLFMTALFVRNLQPQQFEPARTAQRIVTWYAARTRLGLWLFLIAFPLAVLVIGAASLMRSWRADPALRTAAFECAVAIRRHFAVLVVALATATAAVILSMVALHMITD
jgi:anti-sigma factor RsiW